MTEEQIQEQRDEREAKLNDLIKVASWLKEHVDVPLPAFETLSIYQWDSKEEATKLAKTFGTCEKSADESFFRLTKSFGTVILQGVFSRAGVCERVVVGTKEIETEEADPVAVAAIPKVKVKKQVEVVEWKCPDLLAEEPTPTQRDAPQPYDPDHLNPAKGGNRASDDYW